VGCSGLEVNGYDDGDGTPKIRRASGITLATAADRA
jgi:hypothetical protein